MNHILAALADIFLKSDPINRAQTGSVDFHLQERKLTFFDFASVDGWKKVGQSDIVEQEALYSKDRKEGSGKIRC
jgi:hypothetical protein